MSNRNPGGSPEGGPNGPMGFVTRLVDKIMQKAAKEMANSRSALFRHVEDAALLDPNLCRIDLLNFKASISAAGVVTQPDDATIPAGYHGELFGIAGYCDNATASFGVDMALVTFNVKEKGAAAGELFSTDQDILQYASSSGPGAPIYFDRGLYMFKPGSTIQVPYTVASGWAGAARKVGITLIVSLIAKELVRDFK